MHTRLLLSVACLTLCGGAAMALDLTTDGRSDYVIVLSNEAIIPEQTAAKELQAHLKAVTGATLPIRDEAATPAAPHKIVVGPGERFRKACPDVDFAALKHDGIVIRTVGDTLYLAGGRPRGTLYAVTTFLEDTVGCRWWSATESFTPNKPTLTIPALNTVYTPKLQYREAFYRGAFDGVFAARLRTNGHFERVPAEYGGHYTILGWCHTFNQLLPPEKYFAAHPDWYSLVNGKRTADGAQLCLTNDEMRQELVRQALAWIRKDPSAGMISIAQNDCGGRCECPKCKAVEEAEGAPSGLLIQFVNSVAADIEKEYPNFLVETLAYSYTRQPPKTVKPRKNVVVRLCSIECSYSQPLATGPQNAKFKSDIEKWSAVSPQLYIWDYVTDFANYIIPHPNLRVLAPNIRFFVEHNAIGLFEQGDAACSCSDFPELRAWLIAHLEWNPNQDDRALISEFLRGYYGPAAGAMQRYIDTIHNAAEKSGVYLSCYMGDTSGWLGIGDMVSAYAAFREAEAATKDDPALSARVRRARLPLDHAVLQRYYALRRAAKAQGVAFPVPDDPAAFCEDFIKAAESFSAGNISEGGSFAAYVPGLRARFRPAGTVKVPDLCKGIPDDAWSDIQDNEFRLYEVGNWVTSVDDPKASDGRAARMTTNHTNWATQWQVSGDVTGKWHVYVVARCEAKVKEGEAFDLGLYDNEKKQNVAGLRPKLEDMGDGDYRTYDLGVHDLTPQMYFWAAPLNNPDKVTAIFIDRVFLVKEK